MLLDEAADRIKDETQARFNASIESARAAAIYARDQAQYNRWRHAADRRQGIKPQGKGLGDLARDFGGNVSQGGFEFEH